MAEPHVICALRNRRAELVGTLRQLEQQLARERTNLAHLDATMRLFDPNIRPKDIRPRQRRTHNAWFRQGTVQSLGGSGRHRQLLRWFGRWIEQMAKSGSERAIVDRATNLKNGISATP